MNHTWSLEGLVMYNFVCQKYIEMVDGTPVTTYNLLDAYLFVGEMSAKSALKTFLDKKSPWLPEDPEAATEFRKLIDPANWEVRQAKLTATHK